MQNYLPKNQASGRFFRPDAYVLRRFKGFYRLIFATSIVAPKPYDTTLLNYNWQIWNTKAYSIYAGQTNCVEDATSSQTIDAILRFLYRIGVSRKHVLSMSYDSIVLPEHKLVKIRAHRGGIYYRFAKAGNEVKIGDVLAKVLDPYDCSVLGEVKSPCTGTIFLRTTSRWSSNTVCYSELYLLKAWQFTHSHKN